MLDEFSTNLVEELDYYAEAYNMSRLAANMAECRVCTSRTCTATCPASGC